MKDLSVSTLNKAKRLPSMHITDTPHFNNPANAGYRYFIEFDNLYGIVGRYKTEKELEEKINSILRSMGL